MRLPCSSMEAAAARCPRRGQRRPRKNPAGVAGAEDKALRGDTRSRVDGQRDSVLGCAMKGAP